MSPGPGGAGVRTPWGRQVDRSLIERVGGRVAAGILSGSLVLLLVLPLVALVTFAPASALVRAMSDPAVAASVRFTLLSSGTAAAFALLLGVPLGYAFARFRFPGRSVLSAVVTLPVVIPHLIAGLALFLLFAPNSPFGAVVARLGIPIFQSFWGVVLVMLYVSAPYTVLASEIAFRGIDPEVLEAARSLGASPSDVFASVTLPGAARGIVSGVLLSWARAVSEIGGFLILAYYVTPSFPYSGPVTNPLSIYVYNLYNQGDVTGAVAVSSLFLLIAFALFVALRLAEQRNQATVGRTMVAHP